MKLYRVMHMFTHELDEVTAANAREACQRLGWMIGECWVVHVKDILKPPPKGRYVNSPKRDTHPLNVQ